MRHCRLPPRQRWHLRGRRLAAWLGVLALCLRLLLPALHEHAAHGHGPWPKDPAELAVAATCACGHLHGATGRGSGDAPLVVQAAQLPLHTCLACDFAAFAPCGAAPTSQFVQPPVLPVADVWLPLLATVHELASPAATGRGPPCGPLQAFRTILT